MDEAHALELFPLDSRCRLLSNLLWIRDEQGRPTLQHQHLWVRFPRPIEVNGAQFATAVDLYNLRFETTCDEGHTWDEIARVATARPPEGDMRSATPPPLDDRGTDRELSFCVRWPARRIDNLRVVVAEPANPVFPLRDYFQYMRLLYLGSLDEPDPAVAFVYVPLTEGQFYPWQPVAGNPARNIYDRLGHCHQPMETNRVHVSADADTVTMLSPVLTLRFSRHFALLRALGWDMTGQGRERDNLLSSGDTQGAFPVVLRGIQRRASDGGGGTLEVHGRRVTYRDVSVVPELRQTLTLTVPSFAGPRVARSSY